VKKSTFCLPWPTPLVRGKLQHRRHRFLLDVKLDNGKTIVAYCANPGRMESLIIPGARVWLSKNPNKKTKLEWTWEMVETPTGLVATNSAIGNRITKALLTDKLLKGFKQFKSIKAESKISKKTRIDFELSSAKKNHFVEVKGAHLVYPDGNAYFPDSLTIRSSRQLKDLSKLSTGVSRATLLIVVPCASARSVLPSDSHDPEFCKALRKAAKNGVNIRAILVEPTQRGMVFKREIPVNLKPYSTTEVTGWRKTNQPHGGWEVTK
jgi:sugar fermentation stimulation protein A